jgi:hypothetical protein
MILECIPGISNFFWSILQKYSFCFDCGGWVFRESRWASLLSADVLAGIIGFLIVEMEKKLRAGFGGWCRNVVDFSCFLGQSSDRILVL